MSDPDLIIERQTPELLIEQSGDMLLETVTLRELLIENDGEVVREHVAPDVIIEVVEQGPPGRDGRDGTGGDSHYVHVQGFASTQWIVDHNLGKFPAVLVQDESGDVCSGHISHQTINRVVLNFSAAISGRCICN